MKTVGELIKDRPVHYAELGWTATEASKYMKNHDIGILAVLDDGVLSGIVSERDIMCQVIAEDLDPKSTRLSEVMTREITTADPNDTFEECIDKMQQEHCRHLPVIYGGQLLGMISLRDLLQVDVKEKHERLRLLDYLLRYDKAVADAGEYDEL